VQEYEEHPFLKERTAYSFNFPPEARNNRWKIDDRDTGMGRCKLNRDCRQGDGPEHTDPKMPLIRDRLDDHGNLVLKPIHPRVPAQNQHPNYQEQEKAHIHVMRVRPPPFKGAGGARTPFWEPNVEVMKIPYCLFTL